MDHGHDGHEMEHASHGEMSHGEMSHGEMSHGEMSHGDMGHMGHGGMGHGDMVAMFRDRFWLSVLLTIPILIWSEMIQEWLGYTAPEFLLSDRIPAILGTIVFLYGGLPFLQGGVAELRDRQPGMMLLISLAIVVAFVSSIASELDTLDLEFWWELALLIDVMLLGHWKEMEALGRASGALEALAALLPDEAEVVRDGVAHAVPLSEVRPGDLVLVRPGGRVPADGVIEEGGAEFDESMITGESKLVRHVAGDRVVAGTIATDTSVRVRVRAVGEDTALAGIRRLVQAAQSSRSRAQALADRAAAILFYVAVGAGVLTFAVWSLIGETGEAVERTVTVLVISCPHALGLAIPLVISISTDVAARAGILVKDRLALERMRTVNAVLFDKTGTLTQGRPAVCGFAGAGVRSRGRRAARRGGRGRQRAPAGPRDPGRRRPVPPPAGRDELPRDDRPRGPGGRRRFDGRRRGPHPAPRTRARRAVRSSRRTWRGGAHAAPPCCSWSATTTSSEPSRSKTRSGPSRSKPFVRSRRRGSGS